MAPLLANIETDSSFDKEHLDKYTYKMIGGNHSMQVFQKFEQEPIYCSFIGKISGSYNLCHGI